MIPTAISVHLSKDQVSMIWPGLAYILAQWLTREQSGQSVTCYPFAIYPLVPGSDSGTFSAGMMDQIRQLSIKLRPIKTSGGPVTLEEFELRAAIFAARTSIKFERYHLKRAPKKGTNAKRNVATAKRALGKGELRKERLIDFLENELKRTSRLLKASLGATEFKAQSKEWQSHLKWIEFHLTYFKPLPRPGSGRLKRRRRWLDTLAQMAEKAIADSGYELPDRADLDSVLHQFLDYSLRGRMGEDNHMYMTRNSDSSVAQLKLLDFIQDRVLLKEIS